jgi:rod shape-determining protein MreD
MIRRIMPGVWIVLMILMDIAILPQFVHSPLLPSLTLLSVAALGLLKGRSGGVLHGVMAGLIMDIAAGSPVGMNIIIMGLTGYGCGMMNARRFRRWMMIAIGGAGSVLLHQLAWILYVYITGAHPAAQAVAQLGWMALIALGLETIIYLLLYWIVRPGGWRYAIR